jgi:hypothetical protein
VDSQIQSASEAFKFLYAQLASYQLSFFDSALKVTASLLLVAGWVITSESARELLRARAVLRYAGALLVMFCSALYALMMWRLHGMSGITKGLLDELGYWPPSYYVEQEISWSALWLFVAANALISALVALLILQQRQKAA